MFVAPKRATCIPCSETTINTISQKRGLISIFYKTKSATINTMV